MTNRLLKVLCMGALLCVSSPLRAQQEVDCAALATTLATGALQDIRAQEHAYTNIQLCPVAARATGMSRALERRKYVASFNDLNTEVFALVTRDKPVFDALVHMSGDRSASSTARVLAIATLLAMVDAHRGVRLEEFTKYREGQACVAVGSPVQPPTIGGPLAPDSTERVVEALRSLERSRSTEPAVRSAANCALNVIRFRELGQVAEIAPFATSDIVLRYKCRASFVVTNRSPFSYLATVRVPGGVRPEVLIIQGTRGKRASQDTMFEGASSGSVELVIDDVRYTASSSNRPCGHR